LIQVLNLSGGKRTNRENFLFFSLSFSTRKWWRL
jgi:hypothetical protein